MEAGSLCVWFCSLVRQERRGEGLGKEGRGGGEGGTTVLGESVWDSAGVFDTAVSCWLYLVSGSNCWGRVVDCGVCDASGVMLMGRAGEPAGRQCVYPVFALGQ